MKAEVRGVVRGLVMLADGGLAVGCLSGCTDDTNPPSFDGGGGGGRDLDCADVDGPIIIEDGYDPHGFDGDGDGIGCEAG